jgi:ACS family glucarate transporter-like MFS transporter
MTQVLQVATSIRFRILGLLFLLSFVNYLLRNNLSVAAPSIRSEFGFSNEQLGWIFVGFNIAYTIFQVPASLFGERIGPRRAFTLFAIAWAVITVLTGLVPALLAASATGALAGLIAVRFTMGVTHAPMFPVAAATFANWFPVGQWAFPNSMLSAGLTLGQAAVGPVVTTLITMFGWRASFYLLAPLGLAIAGWWWTYARDTPATHKSVSPAELALIDRGRDAIVASTAAPWQAVLVKRDVLLLAASYFCMNYVFYMFSQWLFTYLVEERGFTLLEGGLLYALPFVTGAVLAVIGGTVCDALCRRIGPVWGCRLPAVTGLTLVAILIVAGARAPDPYVAVALLSLCFGFTQFTEGAFWSATTYSAGPHTATATGVLNTGGNAAGFLAPLVGFLLDRLGWGPTLASGSIFALVGAALWFGVRLRGHAINPAR